MDDSIKKDSLNIISRIENRYKEFDNSTILITGAFGFLGIQFIHFFSNLIEECGINLKIIALDNFIRGEDKLVDFFSKKNTYV